MFRVLDLQGMPPGKGFNQTFEFCGACHDLTVPVLNHGMPEQQTYSEWKHSAFGHEGGISRPARTATCRA